MKIDIPKVLLDLRAEVKKSEEREKQGRLERWGFRIWAWVMRHPRIYEMAGMAAASIAPSPESGAWVRDIPPLMKLAPVRRWLSQRDLPPAPSKTFRQMWRQR